MFIKKTFHRKFYIHDIQLCYEKNIYIVTEKAGRELQENEALIQY